LKAAAAGRACAPAAQPGLGLGPGSRQQARQAGRPAAWRALRAAACLTSHPSPRRAPQATAKDLTSAAYALAYLDAKSDRRLWGKVFAKAAQLKGSFDAASLSTFLWAISTAKVGCWWQGRWVGVSPGAGVAVF
jgi:hypothetical protein